MNVTKQFSQAGELDGQAGALARYLNSLTVRVLAGHSDLLDPEEFRVYNCQIDPAHYRFPQRTYGYIYQF